MRSLFPPLGELRYVSLSRFLQQGFPLALKSRTCAAFRCDIFVRENLVSSPPRSEGALPGGAPAWAAFGPATARTGAATRLASSGLEIEIEIEIGVYVYIYIYTEREREIEIDI